MFMCGLLICLFFLSSSKLAQNLFQVIITKFFVVLRSITTLLIGLSFADSLLRQLVFTRG